METAAAGEAGGRYDGRTAHRPSPRCLHCTGPCRLLLLLPRALQQHHGWRCTGERASNTHAHTGASFCCCSSTQPCTVWSSPAEASRLRSTPLETPLLQDALWRAVVVPRRAECLAAVHAALEAGAGLGTWGGWGRTALHSAARFNTDATALTATVEALVVAGADVRFKDIDGAEPLHAAPHNSNAQAAAAAVRALLAAGVEVLAKTNGGWTALRYALHWNNSHAAEALLEAMPTDSAMEDLCTADIPVARQLLPAFVTSRLPLTDAQWARIPAAPTPGLARALPAALACSVDQARQLVRRLPEPDVQRLRTAALCLARVQRSLPLALVERILCSALDDS